MKDYRSEVDERCVNMKLIVWLLSVEWVTALSRRISYSSIFGEVWATRDIFYQPNTDYVAPNNKTNIWSAVGKPLSSCVVVVITL